MVRVVVKVRFAPFFTSTHGQKLDQPTADPAAITEAALRRWSCSPTVDRSGCSASAPS